jgi:hypothetical protein
VEEIGQYFGIDIVPIVLTGTLADGVNYVAQNPKSQVALNGATMEGLVGKISPELFGRGNNRIICKIKCRDFVL